MVVTDVTVVTGETVRDIDVSVIVLVVTDWLDCSYYQLWEKWPLGSFYPARMRKGWSNQFVCPLLSLSSLSRQPLLPKEGGAGARDY